MKNVLVCGSARSGQAAAKLIRRLNAEATLRDITENDVIEGFDLVVISPGIPFDLPPLEKAREAGIPVWGEIELAYRHCPCPIIAITGTNGKTTVTTLVGEIMQRHNGKTMVVGNIGDPFTEHVLSLGPDNWVVAEVSSFQLETTCEFAPRISAVLNMTPDHLDRHKTMDIYQYTKEKIFANQKPDDFTILGYDNEITRGMRPPCNTIFFSAKERLENGVYLDNGTIRFRDIEIPIDGARMLPENALAAAALTLCAGVPAETISEVIMDFKGVAHRIEYVTAVNDVEFYNDSKATNTDSAVKGIEAMNRPIILIGGGYDKGSKFDDWVRHFEGKVKHLVVIGAVADQIIDTCRDFGFSRHEKAPTLEKAVQFAYAKAQPGDCVLLSPACASWDMFGNFEERGDLFKRLVRELE